MIGAPQVSKRRSIGLVVVSLIASALTLSAARVEAAGGSQALDAVGVALEQASDTGARVEITSQETEFSTSYANPTGTLTTELSSTPVRVEQDGDWVPVDYDLTVADGQVVPKAGDTDVAFSDGGDRDLGGVQAGSEASLDVGWLHNVPTPTLAGNTATYAEVLPGVDLIMTAIPGGYTEVLKVKNAAAAANPALNELRFPTDVQGLPGPAVSRSAVRP